MAAREPTKTQSQPPLGLFFAALIASVLLLRILATAWGDGPAFDDAYMFHRYAVNLRDGLGISWNPDGVPTYGLTSTLWVLVIVPLTYLPLNPGQVLVLASWTTCLVALAIIYQALRLHVRSPVLTNAGILLLIAIIPILLSDSFGVQASNGMDTMLSLCANALVVFCALRFLEAPSSARALGCGAAALFAVMARPENGLCALLVPLLIWMQSGPARRIEHLRGLVLLPAVGVAVHLVGCYAYFGTPLPLSFFVKSPNTYAEFLNQENAVTYLFKFASASIFYVILAIVASSGRQLRAMAPFVIPLCLTFAYLLTVRQIMGFEGRLYFPFLPYVIVPAILAFDARLREEAPGAIEGGWKAAAILAGIVFLQPGSLVAAPVEGAYLKLIRPIDVVHPQLRIKTSERLPAVGRVTAMRAISEEIVSKLPKGAVVAASEVGYLGATAQHVSIVDLVGLNDTTIGLGRFSMDYVLEKSPDLIWFPHPDYVGLRKAMFEDPRLLERYTVIGDAFDYGIAIRKVSPYREDIEKRVADTFDMLYGERDLSAYIAN